MTPRQLRKRSRRSNGRSTPRSCTSAVPILPALVNPDPANANAVNLDPVISSPASSNPINRNRPRVPTPTPATPPPTAPAPRTSRTITPPHSPHIINLIDEHSSPSPEPLPTALFRVTRAARGSAEVIEIFDSADEATPRVKRPRVTAAAASLRSNTEDEEVTITSHVRRGRRDHTSLQARSDLVGSAVAEGVEIVGGKRGVCALVDYPHFRFQCGEVEFDGRSKRKARRFCARCFCYVCDVPAGSCKTWSVHAGAEDSKHVWREKRSQRLRKQRKQAR